MEYSYSHNSPIFSLSWEGNSGRIFTGCADGSVNVLDMANINCEECGGKKYSSQKKEVQLIIKPGTYNGCKVTFKGEGEEYPGIEPGDIIFDINIKENLVIQLKIVSFLIEAHLYEPTGMHKISEVK